MLNIKKPASNFEKMLNISLMSKDIVRIGMMKSVLSWLTYFVQGKIDLASQISHEALQIAKESGDIFSNSFAFGSHRISCFAKGFLEEAKDHFLKGVELSEKINQYFWNSTDNHFLGEIYFEVGEYTPLGRKAGSVATQLFLLLLRHLPLPDRLLVVIDDSPTKRYGPKVEGADIHHNPTPGPADQKYLYGHIWVTLSLALRHPLWGAMALPLRALPYVRRKTLPTIPEGRDWTFRTKLELAAHLVEWLASLVKKAGKTLWVVVDGGYTKLPFLKRASAAGVVVVGRLRKDAALRDLPRKSLSSRNMRRK